MPSRSNQAVIIPYNGEPSRQRQYDYVRRYYSQHYETVTGQGSDPWCKADAIADGLAKTTADNLIICDADLILPVKQLKPAEWAIPFRRVLNLTEGATDRVLAGGPLDDDLEKIRDKWKWAGGCWIISRELYEAHPVDPAFVGWGGEDEAFCIRMNLMYKKFLVREGDAYHLWHPPQPTRATFARSKNWKRLRRWRRATTREAVEKLIDSESFTQSARGASRPRRDLPGERQAGGAVD